MKKEIKWRPKLVQVSKIKPTPNNYKIKNELGRERLSISMKLFGNASTVVVNRDFFLIDGNSRLDEEKSKGTKRMWVMMPDRRLTPKQYKEMAAMFDYAKAGDVDTERIFSELGTSKDFYDRWKEEMPMHLLDKMKGMGKNKKPVVDTKALKYPEVDDSLSKGTNIMMVQLFFNAKEEAQFRKMEEKLAKKWKETKSTTERVMKAFKQLTK